MALISKSIGNYFSGFIKNIDAKLEHKFYQNKKEQEKQDRIMQENFLKWSEQMAKHENTPPSVKSISENVVCVGISLAVFSALTWFLVKIDFHM